MKKIAATLFVLLAASASSTAQGSRSEVTDHRADPNAPYVVVLGVAQDGGYPQAGCRKACCRRAWDDPTKARGVVCLAIVDPQSGSRWLLECTPDFKQQLHALDEISPPERGLGIDGIFLTHAHVGHYTGLINLGGEMSGAPRVPVYAMPRMRDFLSTNRPWNQIIEQEHFKMRDLEADQPVELNERIRITPIAVPHRDEFSETVAFRINGPSRAILFLPDIDKWDRWERAVEREIAQVDVAYLDATFFADGELPNRNMRDIPHPFAVESIERFSALDPEKRGRVHFIHLNHSNPLLDPDSAARRQVKNAGMHVAEQGEREKL